MVASEKRGQDVVRRIENGRRCGYTCRAMRWCEDHYECARCGVTLDVLEYELVAAFIDGSESEREYRVLMLRGEEIHRCEVGSDGADADRRRVP